ncbi:uncharacterized protein AB675_7264 [Cyphellophora attinorum]|uniref:F-box domain-containing protein n=1 Tax=Cyphellophora attinorum TaxID=1664694 RepID=A0A0N1NYN3_9EURO|nr:uncharacterized protein AB675_7264 [Phialophora attinorum]KPI36312.1 hypothetical protein AB675_7264 [Phialophora attinorum]
MNILLGLPYEIRSQILTYVLNDFALSIEKATNTRSSSSRVGPYTPLSQKTLATLPLVNRQLREESLAILWTLPKLLAFRVPFIEHLETLPPLLNATSITTVNFPSRFGSHALLTQLPNLKAIGVCRNALGRSPDLFYRARPRPKFIRNLTHKWLLTFMHDPTRKARIWCRVVTSRSSYEDVSKVVEPTITAWSDLDRRAQPATWQSQGRTEEMRRVLIVQREAIWVDLDTRADVSTWRWCEPTKHLQEEEFDSARYNPPLVRAGHAVGGQDRDGDLALIMKWWTVAAAGEQMDKKRSGTDLLQGDTRNAREDGAAVPTGVTSLPGVAFTYNGVRVRA